MSVEFNEPEFSVRGPKAKKQSSLSALMIKTGLAKTEKGAQDALLMIAILVFILAGVVFLFAL